MGVEPSPATTPRWLPSAAQTLEPSRALGSWRNRPLGSGRGPLKTISPEEYLI